MPNRIRMSFISLLAIISILGFETTAIGKKKPKRRSARARAAKKVTPTKAPLSLPFVFPIRVKTVSTSTPPAEANVPVFKAAPKSTTTPPVEANVPLFKAAPKTPVLSGPTAATAASAGQLIISEFRLRGPNGASDEFIEIYNASGADHTVAAAVTDGSDDGYGVAAADGVTRCFIPNGTVIPNRGHYLCVNSVGYSLAAAPAGNGTTATGDATYTLDIPDNAGIALFNNSVGTATHYISANRLDAVGSTAEANTLYKEGTGYPALTPFAIDYSFYRDNCGKNGSLTTFGQCSIGTPKDSDNNAADFVYVDTNGTPDGTGVSRIGAPGPENLSSPIQRNASFGATLLDPCVVDSASPNRVRDHTMDPANNSTFGTLEIRRTITNNTGGNVTRLRFRIIDITTFEAPSGIADLRPRSSIAIPVTVDRAPCGSTSLITVQGTTLERSDDIPPSIQQPNGGGFNSTLSAGVITLATPLPPTDNPATPTLVENEINVRFVLGVQQTGLFKFWVNIEALP